MDRSGAVIFVSNSAVIFVSNSLVLDVGFGMAKAGRPRGSTSWWKNADNVAAHHAGTLLDAWLAGLPLEAARALLAPLLGQPTFHVLLEQCWSKRRNDRRFTVPQQLKRDLCELAVAYVEASRNAQKGALQSDRYKAWLDSAEAIQITLQKQGVQIGSLSKPLVASKDWKRPDLERVLKIVNRRAPPITFRRKARARKKLQR